MKATDVLKSALSNTQFLLTTYVSEMSDADVMTRPVPEANHIAWQLGHLISSEISLVRGELPEFSYPEMPAGFMEAYNAETSKLDAAEKFLSLKEYVDLFNSVRAATISLVEGLTDADLDKPTQGPLKEFAPTLGELLLLVSNHTLMHGGQFTVVRRKLGKPIIF